jgi:xylulokinase
VLLGIDVGTTHTKVGCYAEDGRLLAHRQAPTPLVTGAEGSSHYDPDAMWQVSAGLIRAVTEQSEVAIAGLAVASMGESGVTLDARGQATFPIIPWYDDRAAPHMQRLTAVIEPAEWFAITGLYPNPIHTVAKWVWLAEHEPSAWRSTRRWLSVSDYLGYRLTDEAVMEASQAARTMASDVGAGAWSPTILDAAGVDASLLPPIVPAATPLGTVTPAAAAATGLAAGTPVFTGGHDHICAALACGALTPNILLDSQGTAEALTLGLPVPPDPGAAGGFGTGPHVIGGYSYLLGGVYSSGGALQWLKGRLNLDSFETLRELAGSVPPAEAPLFIAHFHGAAPPFNDPEASAAWLEVRIEHEAAHLARAVYEGVAFELRAGLEALERVTRVPIELVRMVGGNAADPLWSGIRAAVLGRPLELACHADMVTLGAALLAGLGAGIYPRPEAAVERTYRARTTFMPDPAWQRAYDERYPDYLRYASALQDCRRQR